MNLTREEVKDFSFSPNLISCEYFDFFYKKKSNMAVQLVVNVARKIIFLQFYLTYQIFPSKRQL